MHLQLNNSILFSSNLGHILCGVKKYFCNRNWKRLRNFTCSSSKDSSCRVENMKIVVQKLLPPLSPPPSPFRARNDAFAYHRSPNGESTYASRCGRMRTMTDARISLTHGCRIAETKRPNSSITNSLKELISKDNLCLF